MNSHAAAPPALDEQWRSVWPQALASWSAYVVLREPTFFETDADAKVHAMAGQIAAIRLIDQAVMVNLATIRRQRLEDAALAILAHEIGHHVYVPGNLADNARLIAAIKPVLFGLPEDAAGLVANLYGDLLINDRLQRRAGVDIAAVYRRLNDGRVGADATAVWKVYTRVYEQLWRLAPGTLAPPGVTQEMTADAALIARMIRHYAMDWLRGARRFACILYPYLHEDENNKKEQTFRRLGLADTRCAGQCHGRADADAIPNGLTGIDPAELGEGFGDDADDLLDGLDFDDVPDEPRGRAVGRARGGRRSPKRDTEVRQFREPLEYGELLRALGLKLSDDDIFRRYYRERALPHLIPFPTRKLPQAKEPLAEGYDVWEATDNLDDLDLFGSLAKSPEVIPGVTAVRRVFGESPGNDPAREPVDLYLGIDCSGSMPSPRYSLSYPVLAGAIMVLSALRAGARVMVVLSGEPGSSLATDGFITDERKALGVLTSYLGTGYTFGIHRLRHTFGDRKPTDRPAHIVIVTDHDIYSILDAEDGWACAADALVKARGGGTYVLNMPESQQPDGVARMRGDGWKVHTVRNWEETVGFARAFVRENYEERTP